MKTHHQKLVSSILEQYTTVNEDGETVISDDYPANHKITLAGVKHTLRQWAYYAYYGYFPKGRIRVASTNRKLLEPSYMYSKGEF
ncbi:hypothetical protein [Nitrincola sp.]|uniref:hypothetical protein n=1 Tax=Nitrincola sp. TaxID=1926584 RepID=UPI003A90E751